VAGGVSGILRGALAALYGAAWEGRRAAYARGWKRPAAVPARIVSVGNLTVGGTGKTTLTLWLARRGLERGLDAAVVCRRYRPGPGGRGDEELMYGAALGAERVFAGRRKLELARAAAAAGRGLVLVDDGFSHWALAREVDVVLLDAGDLLGGGRLLPAGRLREPVRALQRASAVVVSRLPAGEAVAPWLERVARLAPGAVAAAGRHRVTGVRGLSGGSVPAGAGVVLVTATGNPRAVQASAREAGLRVDAIRTWRDHHWFTAAEAGAAAEEAGRTGGWVLVTAKDAVRWPQGAARDRVAVLDVEWEWVWGGEAVERLVLAEG
jgi:tetraacyldisaccharide 4'-kinase